MAVHSRTIIPLLCALAVLLFVPLSSVAAPSNPPEANCDPDECVQGAGGPLGYDVTAGGTRTPPFEPVWPIAPNITSSATVTPSSLFSNQTDGRSITLSPGSYGDITINGQDQEYVIQEGATIGGILINGSARRIRIRGETPRACLITGNISVNSESQDTMIDGVNQDASNSSDSRNTTEGTRTAVVNSRLVVQYTVVGSFPNSGDTSPDHVIVANNELINLSGSSSANRLQNVRNIIVVDNRLRASTSGNNLVFRIHAPSSLGNGPTENVWFEGNQLEGGKTWFLGVAESSGGTSGIGNVYVRNNVFYYTEPSATVLTVQGAANPVDDRPDYMNLRGNQAYGANLSQFVLQGDTRPSWDIENNNQISGSTSPPAWNFN